MYQWGAGAPQLSSLYTIFTIANRPPYNQAVMRAGFRGRQKGQQHEMPRCSRIPLGSAKTTRVSLGAEVEPCSAKSRDVLQRTVTQKVQRWQHIKLPWWFVICLPPGAAEPTSLLWSFIVRITNYTSGCMKVTSIIPSLCSPGTNVCIWV